MHQIDKLGMINGFGGAFIPEILRTTFEELGQAFRQAKSDLAFWQEYVGLMANYSGRLKWLRKRRPFHR